MRPEIKDAIDRYANEHIAPGGFLTAVLENNLSEALGRADEGNLRDIHEIVKYIYWNIPAVCWGSPEKVKRWLSMRED